MSTEKKEYGIRTMVVRNYDLRVGYGYRPLEYAQFWMYTESEIVGVYLTNQISKSLCCDFTFVLRETLLNPGDIKDASSVAAQTITVRFKQTVGEEDNFHLRDGEKLLGSFAPNGPSGNVLIHVLISGV